MIENLKRDFEILQENEKFKEWKEKNNESYLCSAFLMNEDNKGNWQIDYFNPEAWDITSFLVREKEIKINNPEKIFQKEKEKVKELVIENVKVTGFGAFINLFLASLNVTSFGISSLFFRRFIIRK